MKACRFFVLMGAVVMAFSLSVVYAADTTWNGAGGNNNWTNVANWGGAAPTAGDLLFFDGANRLINTNNLTANMLFNGLTFNSGASSFTLWGNAINLGGGLTNNSALLQTVNFNMALTGTRDVDVVSGGTLTVGGIISGSGFGLTKHNSGTLVLSGANAFTGVVTLNGGTLRATSSASALGTGAATLTLAGGTLELAGTGNLNFARNTTVSGNTVIVSDRTVSSTTSITHTLGTLSIGGQTLTVQRGANVTGAGIGGITFDAVTLAGAAIFDVSSGALLTFSSTVDNGGNLVTIQGEGNTTASGIISGSGGLTKAGAGTLILSAANTYDGDTTINGGTLRLGNLGAIPSGVGNGNLIVNSLGTLDIGGTGGSVNGLSGSGTIGKSVTGADTLTVGNNDATSSFGGVITDTVGTLNLTKTGTGTLTLGGGVANTYSGATAVNAGTLLLSKSSGNAVGGDLTVGDGSGTDTVQLTANNQITDGAVVAVASSGLLNLNGNSDMVGNTTVTGGSITTGGGSLTVGTLGMTAGSITTGAGTLTLGGAVTGSGSATSATISGNLDLGGATRSFTIANGTAADDMVISAITSNGGLTKAGAGLLLLGGPNTYSGGTTINAGTLALGNDLAIGTGTLSLSGGGVQADGSTRILTNAVIVTANSTVGGSLDLTFSGSVSPDNSRTLTINNTGLTTFSAPFLAITAVSGIDNLTLNVAGTSGGLVVSSVIQDGTGTGADGLIKDGTGILTLSGDNTFTGTLDINAGTVIFGNDRAGGLGTIALAGGVVLQGAGGTRTITNNLTMASATYSGGQDLIFTDSFDQGAGTTYTVDNSTTFSGNIFGGDALIKAGGGTLILGGSNVIGAVTVNAGALRAENKDALGTTVAVTTVNSGGALELFGGIAIGAEALSLSGTGLSNGGALRNISGDNSWAGTITLANVTGPHRINSDSGLLTITGGITETGTADNKNLTFGGAGKIAVTGNITADAGDMLLTKTGTGTTILSGTNTYTGGTTVNGGTLLVNNTGGSGTGTGAVNVNITGTLGGNGIISGSVTNNAGGTISPGNSIGVLETGSETWKGGSTFLVEINDVDAGAGIGHDTLDINGFLNITASSGDQAFISVASLTLGNAAGAVHDWDPTQSYIWTIATTISGLSFLPAEDETTVFQLLLGDFTAYNDLQGGVFSLEQSGNNLNLIFTPVPEPGTLALMLLGLVALVGRRKR